MLVMKAGLVMATVMMVHGAFTLIAMNLIVMLVTVILTVQVSVAVTL